MIITRFQLKRFPPCRTVLTLFSGGYDSNNVKKGETMLEMHLIAG